MSDDVPPAASASRLAHACFLAACPECELPFVVTREKNGLDGSPACPVCSATGHLMPVAYFSPSFRERLERLVNLIYSVRVPAPHALAAALRLDRIMGNPTRNTVRAIIRDLSGLEAIETLLPPPCEDNDTELRQFAGLLKALLSAYADGVYRTLPASAALRRYSEQRPQNDRRRSGE